MNLSLSTQVIDKYTNYLKKVVHQRFEIRKDCNMLQRVEVVYYENLNGDFGRPLLEVLLEDYNNAVITEEYYRQACDMFKTRFYEADTAGVMVDPATGQRVYRDSESGQYPEGSIDELSFWQSLPSAFFTRANLETLYPNEVWREGSSMADLVYNGLLFSAMKMIERSRV